MKIKDLKGAEYNPRTITDEQLERLKKALHEFGDLSGIIKNIRTGNLVGGHQRIKIIPADAIIEIAEKYKKPSRTGTVAHGFIIVDGEKYTYREVDWDEAKEKAANIAANQHGGEFDDEKLSLLLKELKETDIDIDLLGFDNSEFNQLLSLTTNEGLTDPDDVPEVAEPITKAGDLWLCGNHRLLCGDATKKEDVERLMDGKKADMVFTDPPYGMKLDTDFSSMKGIFGNGKKYKPVINDDKDYNPTHILNNFNYCKEIFLWGADYFAEKIPERNKGSWIVWDKTEGGVRTNSAYDKMYGSNFELCWSKAKHKRALARILWKGIFGLNKDDTKKRIHPAQKPTELILWFFEKFKGDLILDPFLGSGSTMIAAEKTNRICFGMEIDPHYCDIIIKRWENFTGKKAERKT